MIDRITNLQTRNFKMYDKELAARLAEMQQEISMMRREIDQLYSFNGRQPMRHQERQAKKAGQTWIETDAKGQRVLKTEVRYGREN
jgi:hypothetical protein